MYRKLLQSALLTNVVFLLSVNGTGDQGERFISRPSILPSGLLSGTVTASLTTNPSDFQAPVVGCEAAEKNLVEKFDSNPIENIYLRPSNTRNATLVKVAIDVKNIPWIHENESQWKMELDFFQFWNDPRLAYSTEGCPGIQKFSLPNTDKIWKPDLFFPLNEDGFVHIVPQTNFLLWVAPNGDVTYSVRLTLIMECTGKGSMAGELLCPLIISSYRNPKDNLNIEWVKQNPVQIFWDRVTLSGYQIENVSTEETEHTIRVATYSYAVANFRFVNNMCSSRPGTSF